LDYHTESVRTLDFSPDGNVIYTASADRSIGVIAEGGLMG